MANANAAASVGKAGVKPKTAVLPGKRRPSPSEEAAIDSGDTDAANETAGPHAEALATGVVPSDGSFHLLAEDYPLLPGQMVKADFLGDLRVQVTAAADAELGPAGLSAIGCPYIEEYFQRYAGRSAAEAEAFLRRFVPELANIKNARDSIPLVLERVRAGIRAWRTTGKAPADVLAADLGGGGAAIAQAANGATSAASTIASFGPGTPLDTGIASRMADAFEQQLPNVTVHTGPEAAQATASSDARAMTVGNHVAFAPGAYDPSSPEGEALIAHELAHTIQQDGAQAGGFGAPLAEEREEDEEDADQAAGGALTKMWGGVKRGARALMNRTRTAVRSGFRLQRCSGGTTPKYRWNAHRKGPHEKQRVGSVDVRQIKVGAVAPMPIPVFEKRKLWVGDTVAELPSSDEALAVAKTLGARSVVIAGDGMFFVYKLERDGDDSIASSVLAPVTVDLGDQNLLIEPSAIAVITANGAVFKPGLHGAVADNREQANAYGNPFAQYVAVNQHKGGLAALDEAELLAVFQAAMKDNALAILGESERQAHAKAKQFAGGAGAVSTSEHGTMEDTARAALEVQTQIEATNTKIGQVQQARANQRRDVDWVPDAPETKALQARLKTLEAERRRIDAAYPMIGRYRDTGALTRFLSGTKEERIARLAGDARGVISNIGETRTNVLAGEINLWLVPGVVESTIAGLGLAEESDQRKWVLAKAGAQAKADAVSTIALAAFSIGLGLAAAFATGGASIALTVGAMGLGVYDALEATEDYYEKQAATDTDIDKIDGASLLPEEMRGQWGWLVVAWIGVGLDLFDAVKAARLASELHAVSTAGRSLDDVAEAMAGSDRALLARLRRAAGDLNIDDVITQQKVGDVSRRVGAHVTITNEPGAGVRVRYKPTDAGGTMVTGVEAGRAAKLGDILAHAETVRLLDRRTTFVQQLKDLWLRLRTFGKAGAKTPPFPPGSAAFESWLELQKLDELLGLRRAQLEEALQGGADAAETQALIRRDIEFLGADLDRHRGVVDNVSDVRGGRGFVAMEDDTRQALASGKKLPDVDKPADKIDEADLKRSAYYFVKGEDGDWTPTLKAERTAAPASTPAGGTTPPAAASALRTSMTTRLGAQADTLTEPALVALSKLGDATLAQLKTAAPADLERLAAMLTAAPSLAQRLAGQRNVLGSLMKSTSSDPIDLDRAMFMQRFGDVRADGKPDRIRKAIEGADLTGPQLSSLTYTDVSELGKADAALARARDARRPGDLLPDQMQESLGHFNKITGGDAALRDELRAALSHVHGASDLPFMLDPGAALRARFPDIPKAQMDDLVARHPDALRALEEATEDDVRRVIQALSGSGDPKDVEDILRSYMYKAQKKARKSKDALEPPKDLGDRIESSLSNLEEARQRGYPFGFKDRGSYEKFAMALDQEIKKRGIGGKGKVQGSAMHSKTPGDIDVEILVDQAEFDRLARRFRVDAPARLAEMLETGIAKGKIPSFHFFPDHAPSIAAAIEPFTDGLKVQATLIVRGSDFDLGPFLNP